MGILAAASAQAADFVLDTTLGTYLNYTGDAQSGILDLAPMDGASFRAQLIGQQVEFGNFGVGGATLDSSLQLDSFTDASLPGYGDGDYAYFSGVLNSPYDLMIADEFGNTLSASVDIFEFIDSTASPVLPGLNGQGLLSDVQFSSNTFQGINIPDNLNEGTFYIYVQTSNGWDSLGDLLDSSGEGVVYTFEMHLVPAPGTATLGTMLFGTMALRRRRR